MRRVGTFVAVGGITALINFALIAVFLDLLQWNYRASVTIAYVIAICIHFLLNRHITFGAVEGSHATQIGRYLTMAFVNYVATIGIVWFAVEVLRWNVYVGAFLGLLAAVAIGFVMSRSWVFRESGRDV
jgi:putative flippase GtrA